MTMIPETALPYFLAEMEKVADVGKIRAIKGGVDAATRNYRQLTRSTGLRRFIPFTETRRKVNAVRLDLKAKKREAADKLRDIEQEQLSKATDLTGGDNAEALATMQAARTARKGGRLPAAITPAEQAAEAAKKKKAAEAKKRAKQEAEAQEERAAATSKFKTRAGLAAAGVGAGALYLGTRPKNQTQSMGY